MTPDGRPAAWIAAAREAAADPHQPTVGPCCVCGAPIRYQGIGRPSTRCEAHATRQTRSRRRKRAAARAQEQAA